MADAVTETTDYCFLLAEFEIFGKEYYANKTEQKHQIQYKYYANGNSRIKYKYNDTSSLVVWWTRSPNPYDGGTVFVSSSGEPNYQTNNYCYAIAPCFCV